MAGGKLARRVPCMECIAEGKITQAWRIYEGVEDDRYICWRRLHVFGMDWRAGPATESMWPPSVELIEAVRKSASEGTR
jgi:hypothetical protein